MWKQDLEALLKAWPENRLIKKLEAVYGGIAITDTTDTHWFYDHNEGTLTRLPYTSPEAFAKEYRADRKEAESEAYEKVYKKMRTFAARRGYDLQDWEIDRIVEGAEEDGDSVLDCADGSLRELTEDWIADHQE